jgi:hypothetical protein
MKMEDERAKDLLLQKRSAPKNALELEKLKADIKHLEANTTNTESTTKERDITLQGKVDKADVDLAIAKKNFEILNDQGNELRETFIQEGTGKKFGVTKYGEVFDLQTKAKLTPEEASKIKVEETTDILDAQAKKEVQVRKATGDMKPIGTTSEGMTVFYNDKTGVQFTHGADGKPQAYTGAVNFSKDAATVTNTIAMKKQEQVQQKYLNEMEASFVSLDAEGKPAIETNPAAKVYLHQWQQTSNEPYTYAIIEEPVKSSYSGKVTMQPAFKKINLPVLNGRQWTNQMVREAAKKLGISYEEALNKIAQRQTVK